MTKPDATVALPAPLAALSAALTEAADHAAALEKENVRLLGEVAALTEEITRLKSAKTSDGGAR